MEQLITKEEALNFFAQAAAIAIEKDYMCDEIDDLVYPYLIDDNEDEVYNKLWDDITLYFKEVFGCEYHECY